MKACPDFDPLLPLRAAGALAPDEATRVEAHLALCSACRAEADADAAVLEAVRLPAASPAEREALRELPARTVGAYRALERSHGRARRVLAVTVAAAAAVFLGIVAPGVMTTGGPSSESVRPERSSAAPAAERSRRAVTVTGTATEAPVWRSPDLDALWDETDVLAVGAGAEADADSDEDELALTEAALGAWDDAGF